MLSQQRLYITECVIRNEIKDWFKKLVNEKFGPDCNIRYLSNDMHFNVHTYVEISGSEKQINQAADLIRNTIDVLKYKMPWLNENTYYVRFDSEKDLVEKELKAMYKTAYDITYKTGDHDMIGISFKLFNFRTGLDDIKKQQIDEVFKSFGNITPIFIAYHQTRATRNQSSMRMATNILTTFHGTFLYFLNLQDIISLEIANNQQNPDYDGDLDHDIQKYLRNRFPLLYQGAKIVDMNLKEFSNANVLRYFIHKYHDNLQQIAVPNILTADEIQSLSRTYNILINYHNIIHIDFMSTSNDFCLIYHFDPKLTYFLNYDSKYASENYTMNFNADNDSLNEPLCCSKQFTCFVLRSQNNVSPQKSNSILNCVAQHFTAGRRGSQLILNRFELNSVSNQNLRSLFNMVGRGTLIFDSMSIELKTLIAILTLERAEKSNFKFIKCRIAIEEVHVISNSLQVRELTFDNMDVELKVLSFIKNIKNYKINNCRILNTRVDEVPINITNIDEISISYSDLNISTLLRFLAGLQRIRSVTFLSCKLTPCNLVDERKCFTVQEVLFISTVFEMRTMFQIFENSEIQNRLIFQNCHFRFEQFYNLTIRPVTVEFRYAIFELNALLAILESLNKKSKITIYNSCILALDVNVSTRNKSIRLEFIRFEKCRIETQTLINVLGAMSKTSSVHFGCCELLDSSKVYPNRLTNLSIITFWDMQLNSHDIFVIWAILNENSSLFFRRCDITAENEVLHKINRKKKFKIQLADMTVSTEFARLFLQTDSLVKFNKCFLLFMADELSDISIESNVAFQNMTFDLSSTHTKSFVKFTRNSKIQFWNCHFENTHFIIPSVTIKSAFISFYTTSFDLDAFVTLLERVSKQTRIYINTCDIRANTQVFSIRRITIPSLHFTHMTLELEMILCILKNFAGLSMLQFENCKILCTNLSALPDIKLTPTIVYFRDMTIGVEIFQMLVQKCGRRVTVLVEKCEIISPGDNVLANVSVEIERINFRNINYSIGLLHIVKYLVGHFIVEYHDELSNKQIIEICINTPVHGGRLQLMAQNYTKLICFELFAEFLRPLALNFELDTEAEYDPPTHLIPHNKSLSFSAYDWNALKIKFIPTNDASMKIEFLKNGTPIDLFYELNHLADDSEECAVNYY